MRLVTQTALQSHFTLVENDRVSTLPHLSAALETYLDLKGRDRSPSFESSVRRSVSYLRAELGDKRIDKYARSEALTFRDALLQRQLSISSVKRNFTNINAVLGLVCKELGHPDSATFRGLFFKETSKCAKRLAVPPKQLQQLQIQCITTDDELRWLLAMISDTVVRLSEAIGLITNDIKLHGTVLGGQGMTSKLSRNGWPSTSTRVVFRPTKPRTSQRRPRASAIRRIIGLG